MPLTGSSWNVTYTQPVAFDASGIFISIAIMIAMIGAVLIAFYSVETLTKVIRHLERLFKSAKYVLFGAVISSVGYGLFIVVDAMRKSATGFDPIILGYGIGGYIVLYIVGRIGEAVIMRIIKTVRDYKGENAIENLPGAPDQAQS
jgi:hypothetical protein